MLALKNARIVGDDRSAEKNLCVIPPFALQNTVRAVSPSVQAYDLLKASPPLDISHDMLLLLGLKLDFMAQHNP